MVSGEFVYSVVNGKTKEFVLPSKENDVLEYLEDELKDSANRFVSYSICDPFIRF